MALAIALVPAVDVAGFYPRAARGDSFVATSAGFESATLRVRIDPNGETQTLDGAASLPDEGLPRGARLAAAAATALAGLALALVAARAALRRSLLDERARRRMQRGAFVEGVACAMLTLVAFQAAAAHVVPAAAAVLPSLGLLALALARLRWSFGGVDDRRIV